MYPKGHHPQGNIVAYNTLLATMLPSGWYVLPVVSNQNSCCQKVELVELAATKLPQNQRDRWGGVIVSH